MKILTFAFLLTWFVGSNAELSQHSMAQVLNVSEALAARIIQRIAYIDLLNTQHAPYYSILSNVFLKKRNYKIGCEIGVFTGGHAECILANSAVEKLYCIDPYIALPTLPIIIDGFENRHWDACWETLYRYAMDKLSPFGDRAQFIRLPAEQAASRIANGSLDFLFIDGDHSYTAVLSDCTNYYDKVRSGGIIAGDDYQIDDVRRALHDFFDKKRLVINIYPGQDRFWWVEKP